MNIILFTGITPTKDNYRGPSALMYHLLLHRESNLRLRIYTTNANKVNLSAVEELKNELNAEVIILKDSIYNFFHKRSMLADLRIRLRLDNYFANGNYRLSTSTLNEIARFDPNIIWVYGETYSSIIKDLSKIYNVHVWGYDCFPLRYNRQLLDSYVFRESSDYLKTLYEYKWGVFAEKQLENVKCTYAVVGIADRKMFEVITGRSDAKFFPHPHYAVFPKTIRFQKSKLSILVAGSLDQYNWSDAKKLGKVLRLNSELSSLYELTFLGRGWSELSGELETVGYKVNVVEWVGRYGDEVVKHDVQIIPITVGSGTKGKVLDALSMGLLCVGSKYAMENIYVKSGHSCFQYDDVSEIPKILHFIYSNKDLSETIAENGRQQVLKWHDPKRIMKIICDDLLFGKPYDGEKEYCAVMESLKSV